MIRRDTFSGVFFILAAAHVLAQGFSDLPMVTHTQSPPYPQMARRARITGRVSVQVTIDSNGSVVSADIVDGPPLLFEGVAEAARGWVFESAPLQQKRYGRIVFDYLGTQSTDGDDQVKATYESPGILHVVYLRSQILRLPRVEGRVAEKHCGVHDQRMTVELVPIRCGCPGIYVDDGTRWARRLVALQKQFAEDRGAQFPNAHLFEFPNAQFFENGPDECDGVKAETYFCQLCRDARTNWLSKHRGFVPIE